MTQPPEENPDPLAKRPAWGDEPTRGPDPTAPLGPDFLAKPVSPSGDQAAQQPAPPANPYVSGQPGQQGQPYGQPYQPGPPQGGYAPPPGAAGYGPYGGYPGGAPGYPFAQAHGGANTAMGLGITSVVCALATFVCCLAIVGTVTGPFAVVLALRARKDMRENPGLYNNEGAATTGLVTGIIGTVLGLAATALTIFVFGFLFIGTSSP
jgi:hypothetical protein